MKNHLLLLCLLPLASCTQESNTTDPVEELLVKPVKVELRLSAEETDTTRGVDADIIRDVNLFLFGDTNYHLHDDSPSLHFEVLPGTYRAYVAVNIHADMGALSEEELTNWSVSTETMFTNEDIPMTARIELVVCQSGEVSSSKIRVRRCAAKIAYSIEVADAVAAQIKLRSVQFCNLPRTLKPFSDVAASSDSCADYFNGEVIGIENDKTFSGMQYLFENRQGVVDTITDPKDKSSEQAPACASYLRILAQGEDEVIEYIVYLGENSTSDFNVNRNTQYTTNLIIKGKSEIDFRVMVYEGLYYGTANSIICNGYQANFDITPYRTSRTLHYAYTGIYAGHEYEAVQARVVWQGVANLISSLHISNNMLTVNTNGKKGNALIAICKDDGTILWSFHIWCTAGDTPQDVLCENYRKARFCVMDRNLGASANNPASYVDAAGLVYQWGRKDPFPTTNEDYVYTPTQSGTFLTLFPIKSFYKDASSPFDVLVEQFRKNPATFVKVEYGDIWRDESVSLWGDPEGHKTLAENEYNTSTYAWSSKKSIYDPCPKGYRVANRFTWTGFSLDGSMQIGDNNFGDYLTDAQINIIGSWNYGWQLRATPTDTQGIYYPATQYRDLGGKLSESNLNTKKERSFYWSSAGAYENISGATNKTDRANAFMSQGNQIQLNTFKNGNSAGMNPGFGFSVRCVRE